jgi:hypothetical protein
VGETRPAHMGKPQLKICVSTACLITRLSNDIMHRHMRIRGSRKVGQREDGEGRKRPCCAKWTSNPLLLTHMILALCPHTMGIASFREAQRLLICIPRDYHHKGALHICWTSGCSSISLFFFCWTPSIFQTSCCEASHFSHALKNCRLAHRCLTFTTSMLTKLDGKCFPQRGGRELCKHGEAQNLLIRSQLRWGVGHRSHILRSAAAQHEL